MYKYMWVVPISFDAAHHIFMDSISHEEASKFIGIAYTNGVDVTVTHNHIHLCGASVITSLFNYKNILLQERVINHRVKLYFCACF